MQDEQDALEEAARRFVVKELLAEAQHRKEQERMRKQQWLSNHRNRLCRRWACGRRAAGQRRGKRGCKYEQQVAPRGRTGGVSEEKGNRNRSGVRATSEAEMTNAVRQCGSSVGVEVPEETTSAELRAVVALPTQGARKPPRASLKGFDKEKEASSAVSNAHGEVQHKCTGAGEVHAPIDAKKEGKVSDESREGQDDASKKCSGAEAKIKSAPGEVEKAGQPESGAAAGEKMEPQRRGLSEEQRQQMLERKPPMQPEELRELERRLEEQHWLAGATAAAAAVATGEAAAATRKTEAAGV